MRYSIIQYGPGPKYETPVFVDDRTKQDVDLQTPKGYLNALDLNRIEYRTKELLAVLYAMGYDTLDITPQPDWMQESMPYQSRVDGVRVHAGRATKDYRHNIGQPTIPAVIRELAYGDINDVERSLRLLDKHLKAVAAQWCHPSGATIAGGGINLC